MKVLACRARVRNTQREVARAARVRLRFLQQVQLLIAESNQKNFEVERAAGLAISLRPSTSR